MLDDKRRKSRYSLSYLYAICAQAGSGAQETRQDEDVEAIDAWVKLLGAPVPVQLKCTSSPNETKAGYRVDFEDGWIASWMTLQVPLFIVLVVVPKGQNLWVDHTLDTITLHRTAAFWGRFDQGSTAKSITLSRRDRLTADSFESWQEELDGVFEGGFSA
jgi:Domain of unknown function (DUF4365)